MSTRTGTWRRAGLSISSSAAGQTRQHDDLEIGVPALEYEDIAQRLAAHELELFVVGGGLARPPTEVALASHHQTWTRDRATGSWRLDVFREPADGREWVFRRDPRIRLPASSVVARTSEGIP